MLIVITCNIEFTDFRIKKKITYQWYYDCNRGEMGLPWIRIIRLLARTFSSSFMAFSLSEEDLYDFALLLD